MWTGVEMRAKSVVGCPPCGPASMFGLRDVGRAGAVSRRGLLPLLAGRLGVKDCAVPAVLCFSFSAFSGFSKHLLCFRIFSSPSCQSHFSVRFWAAAPSLGAHLHLPHVCL